ncbi:hypothetical protein A5656_00160 [Mycobacterium gordonae]|nr:hypothetical protein A5656_00160 [Mycobacterium gordonae]
MVFTQCAQAGASVERRLQRVQLGDQPIGGNPRFDPVALEIRDPRPAGAGHDLHRAPHDLPQHLFRVAVTLELHCESAEQVGEIIRCRRRCGHAALPSLT